MKRAGLDFGIKKTTANAIARVYIYSYKFNNTKPAYKLANQIKLLIQRFEKNKGLHSLEISIIQYNNDFIKDKSTLVLKFTDIDKL